MPSIHFQCKMCGLCYKVLVFEGDPATPGCPKCKSTQTTALPKSERLFKGIANFSNLAKDTN